MIKIVIQFDMEETEKVEVRGCPDCSFHTIVWYLKDVPDHRNAEDKRCDGVGKKLIKKFIDVPVARNGIGIVKDFLQRTI